MNVLVVVFGKYPTPEASSKRLSNYIKALQAKEIGADILPVSMNTITNIGDFFFSLLYPLIAFKNVFINVKSYSVVFIYGFGWVGKLSIIIACKIMHKPVAVEVNEKPYAINGGSKRDIILKLFRPLHKLCLTRIVYPQIDGFIVISEKLKDYVNKYKRNSAIVCKIPILVDYDFYQKEISISELQKPYILNSARLNNHKDGILNVLRAYAHIVKEGSDLHFYLTSKVAPRKLLKQINSIIDDYNLASRINFLGDVDEESLLVYQKNCSMLVLNKVDCEQNRYNFATKLAEYLALGKPVITTRIGEVTQYLQDNISCLYVDPNNHYEIAKAITQLLNDHQISEELGEEGRMVAKNKFDYRVHIISLVNFFESLIKDNAINQTELLFRCE